MRSIGRALAAVAALLVLGATDPVHGQGDVDLQAFVGARLIDGTGAPPIEDAVVLVRNGRIDYAGDPGGVTIPESARRLDLGGRTIIPGIINAHGHVGMARRLEAGPAVHTRENILDQLGVYARYGVTTVVSLGEPGFEGVAVREEEGVAPGRARLRVAGEVIAADTPEAARARVREVAAEGVDWIKIRVDDFLGQGEKMSPEVYRAVIREAHTHGLPLAAHIVDLEDAKGVVRAGADLVGHSVRDASVDAELIRLMRERHGCLNPTLTRELSTFVYAERPAFFDDPFFQREADPEVVAELQDPDRQRAVRESPAARYFEAALPTSKDNLRTLAEAGVGIAFGTDSGPPGRFQGYFEHLEMEMMQRAGLDPMRILVSATGEAARCMGLREMGTLEPGSLADFVVLRDDPLDDILHARSIESVWIGGERIPDAG
jgi:imidazolonepropionase-like amidohydrolase